MELVILFLILIIKLVYDGIMKIYAQVKADELNKMYKELQSKTNSPK